LDESKKAGVANFVYLSAASVIMNGKPIKNADESFVSDNLIDGYSRTKLAAEKLALQANATNFRTIAIRPPLIWGKGDPNILPAIIKAIKKGQMQFIGGGLHKIVTCNVTNVCEALLLAEQSRSGGKPYFVNDGEPVVFKDFIQQYVGTQGIDVPDKSVSIRAAKMIAAIMEFVWKTFGLKGHPPLYKAMVNTLGLEFITKDTKARQELGYKNLLTVEQGLSLMK
jgi:nucleoside-diphosphate-sugar epimerase